MKIKKIVLPLLLASSLAVGIAVGNALPREGTIKVYDSSEVTNEILNNRNGKIIIEKIIGKVVNANGDGEVLNCANSDYNYISYSNVKGIHKGDIILTYIIYNPENNIEDDIVLRYDYVTNN